MTQLLRSLIRETLLLEEVYGAQATVYHGTDADPLTLIDALLKDKFRPGEGAGSMYGKGLYTVYDLSDTKTSKGHYGDHVIKLKVNLHGYIIFDPDVAKKVYKKPLTPAQQAEEFGYSDDVISVLREAKSYKEVDFTSRIAYSVFESLQYEVKGLVFTGSNDGRVAVVYDPTTAVPMAWKRVTETVKREKKIVNEPWKSVDRASLLEPRDRPDVIDKEGRPVKQSALLRSAIGDFDAKKWDPGAVLMYLERLPKDKRVVNGNLDIANVPVASVPAGLQVTGDLILTNTLITSLPSGLKVGGNLRIADNDITYLPADIQVGGDLILAKTRITSLPESLRNVNGHLNLSNTPITSLPPGLKVDGNLDISNTPITSLPVGLRVGEGLVVNSQSQITSLPVGLRVEGDLVLSYSRVTTLSDDLFVSGNLYLMGTRITSLPSGLKVGKDIYLSNTPITSLPSDLKVGGYVYGFDTKYLAAVPQHLKGKL